MSEKQKLGCDSQAPQQRTNPTATSLASDRCGVSRAGGGQEVAESLASGAPPSNTAPDNCNTPYFQALRWGVDSLYLSYPGELSRERDVELKALRQLAQSNEVGKQAKAQLALGTHVFEVKEKGASLFPYILEDGAFRIQLSRPGHQAPMAYVKVSAEYLAHVGPAGAEKHLYDLLAQLGEIQGAANVSRIDLYADFVSSVDMESWDRHAWVTRASAINAYAVSGHFSGWSVGLGGIMSARLYNKSLEIITSGKEWITPLWQKAGWDGKSQVWRLEFEIKREVLTQKNIGKLYEVLNHLNGLWSYATTDWLRLTIPSAEDKTRSRWPVHPLWQMLSAIDWETRGGAFLKRFHPNRSPRDDRLFQAAYSAFLSYMAKHGITFSDGYEFFKGIERFLEGAFNYHEQHAHYQGIRFEELMAEKLAIKQRTYGSRMNDPDLEAKRKAQEVKDDAKAYRKASGG